MKIVTGALLALVIAGLAAAAILGCRAAREMHSTYGPSASPPADAMARTAQPAKAHGGTHNVNDAAFDAMFYRDYGVNPFVDTDEDRLSTFAVDVDSGSYTLARSYLGRGALPDRAGVRTEEFINYFDYNYAPPAGDAAFAIHTAAAPSRFGAGRTLLRVGIKGRVIDPADRKDAVLTFVIDVSGSMGREDRLELVKKALHMLVGQLREGDEVGIAIYGSRGEELLSHRSVEHRDELLRAIDSLRPAGSTNAEEGLVIGYKMASRAYRRGAINRVILCSDGVANVGNTGPRSILKQIQRHAGEGITLTTVGFGMGNYNDVLMEQLGDKGNGHYAYVDSLDEAKRVFVDNLTGTLQVVARDVKVQVDFNPAVVRSYRLLGYENRDVADKDFRNDKVDGGEIGAGHAVTALYELKLWPDRSGPLATVRVRYKDADDGSVKEVSREITTAEVAASFDAARPSVKLAACVAEFAEVLRRSYWARGSKLDDVLALARACRNDYDHRKDVSELVELIDKARSLKADEADEPVRTGEGQDER